MRRWLPLLLLCACGSPPQKKNEAAVTYHAKFTAEPGVQATVVFPFSGDAAQSQLEQGLVVTDGGTAKLSSSLNDGEGLTLSGRGTVEANFTGTVTGLGEGGDLPAVLSRQLSDGGQTGRSFSVNKGGSAVVQVELEYTVRRDCGSGCGGERSWKFAGPLGLGIQDVSVEFTESTR